MSWQKWSGREYWARSSLSPLHRTTAVGAGKTAAEGHPAGTVHLLLHTHTHTYTHSLAHTHTYPNTHTYTRIQAASASLCRLYHRGGLYQRGHIPNGTKGSSYSPARVQEEELFIVPPWFFIYSISVTLEVRAVYCERGWDHYSFRSPCVWAPLSRSTWKVSGKWPHVIIQTFLTAWSNWWITPAPCIYISKVAKWIDYFEERNNSAVAAHGQAFSTVSNGSPPPVTRLVSMMLHLYFKDTCLS